MVDPEPKTANFIRNLINADLAVGCYEPSHLRMRFPPEPNGYLHFGHAKSICINFGLARDYGGVCHLRFDDTNPEKEAQEYVDAIVDAVRWLGWDWDDRLYYASSYFEQMAQFAEKLIETGHAYVDSQETEAMRAGRGTLTEPGRDSPWRNRTVVENLDLFHRMKAGEFADGTCVLRAKVDMAAPNINLRDPVIYRIRRITHHKTGDAWCIYPMYTYAHPIEDALERITHSLCTLEFEDQRPFYDWLLERLADSGCIERPLPRQIEFARLNLTGTVLSKRKLIQLVEEGHVEGWDDPRMPTLVGARRRGFTPEGFRRFVEMIGVSKADSWIDLSVLEGCMRDHLNEVALRRIAVLNPINLVIDNYPAGQEETCPAPNHPQKPEWGRREIPWSHSLWIEREDFTETPPKGYFRLFPGNRVRLRYGYVVECTGCEKDAAGRVTKVHCIYLPETKSGTAGADSVKVKGNIHWVSVQHAYEAKVRLIGRLFTTEHPGGDFIDELNPDAMQIHVAQLEPSLREARAEDRFQFERHGYFVADRVDSHPGVPLFNRTVTLKEGWK